ncbi:hypothetical protein M3Y99_00802100 [Aphelenchoides fujianensis]|nr:hypothetical protein M3Y99_00802100 [Aphelenchoides fujianensis]
MGSLWSVLLSVLVLVAALLEAKPAPNGNVVIPVVAGQPANVDDLRRLAYANFQQRQLEEENEFLGRLNSPTRVQFGTVKTRRAPSVEGFEWEGMMQSLDNLPQTAVRPLIPGPPNCSPNTQPRFATCRPPARPP